MKTTYKLIALAVIVVTFCLVEVGYSQVGFFPQANFAPRFAQPVDFDDTFFANPFFPPRVFPSPFFFRPNFFPPPFFFRPGFRPFAPGFGEREEEDD